ncbi:Detected protein of unknown function [Hibiscus syriacus]|uniref:TRF2/HOY1 PH-like domain-containing protein n=1 Tax=Hibiscus syriacus TaxID=106335 RepID=A0A6A2XIS6_HIBSY|nr:Detected protein of unknown function [Hibiscus syriacus]
MEHGELVSDEGTMESAALVNGSSQNFDVNLVEAMRKSPVLGLKLSQTSSFLEKVDQLFLQKGYSFNGEEQASNSSSDGKPREHALQHANKLKAENFLISLLRIGSWQRVSRNDDDLAVTHEDQPGILELELTEPPAFYHEIDPQPRKHTQWRMVSDFTGGQAPTYRHYLEFPPGALDKPLEKLLGFDHRLRMLSQQGFPFLDSPYFPRRSFGGFSLGFCGQLHITQQQQQLSFPNVPTQANQPAPLNSSISGMNVADNSIPNQIRRTLIPSSGPSSMQQDQIGRLVPMQLPSNDHHQSMPLNNSPTGFQTA